MSAWEGFGRFAREGCGVEPPTLLRAWRLLPEDPAGLPTFTRMDEGIAGADVVMMLRIQRERMEDALTGLLGDFHSGYGLTRERLALAAPGAIVMHPGPMNRGIEISGELLTRNRRHA